MDFDIIVIATGGVPRATDRGTTGAFCPGPHYVGGPKGQAGGIQ